LTNTLDSETYYKRVGTFVNAQPVVPLVKQVTGALQA